MDEVDDPYVPESIHAIGKYRYRVMPESTVDRVWFDVLDTLCKIPISREALLDPHPRMAERLAAMMDASIDRALGLTYTVK